MLCQRFTVASSLDCLILFLVEHPSAPVELCLKIGEWEYIRLGDRCSARLWVGLGLFCVYRQDLRMGGASCG